jgi:hypothetical protein
VTSTGISPRTDPKGKEKGWGIEFQKDGTLQVGNAYTGEWTALDGSVRFKFGQSIDLGPLWVVGGPIGPSSIFVEGYFFDVQGRPTDWVAEEMNFVGSHGSPKPSPAPSRSRR